MVYVHSSCELVAFTHEGGFLHGEFLIVRILLFNAPNDANDHDVFLLW